MKLRVWRKLQRAAHSTFRASHIDRLESRQLLAAHIVDDPTLYPTIQAAVDDFFNQANAILNK